MQLFFFLLGLLSLSVSLVHANGNAPTMRIVVLLGPPGSGKGTQAMRLSKETGLPHISTGDLFRENLKNNTPLGEKVKKYMEGGQLVPDNLVLEMLFDRVGREDCSKGYILDGFPRTIPQAEALYRTLGKKPPIVAINLDVSDEVVFKRIEGRLTCSKCGNLQNRYFSPPAVADKCDKCGGDLIQRPDDKADVVNERLKVYHSQTKPLIAYFERKQVLKNIPDGSPDKVYEDILASVK